MTNKVLRAGVIGLGQGAKHAYAYANAPEYELVAVCDLKPEALDAVWDKGRLELGSAKQYTDHKEMIEKENLDVVSVSTPDDYHIGPVCDASSAGVRGIFCEKPICINLKDADLMIETVERNGTKMSVDHTRSYLPSYQAARQEIREGKIGGLTRIVSHLGGSRSMLFRNGTHSVDAICFFADADPVWVIAAHEQGFEDYGVEYRGEGGRDSALDPGSTVIIEFANGVRGILNSAKMTPKISEIELLGPSGRYYLTDNEVWAWRTERQEGKPVLDPSFKFPPAPWAPSTPSGAGNFSGDTLIQAVQELAQMVWNGAESSSPPRRARNTLEILLGALLSQSRDSAKVHLPLPRG
jgi:predicted dehydrogenase